MHLRYNRLTGAKRTEQTRTKMNQKRKLTFLKLESRRYLAADCLVIGDADGNGLFESADLVAVFQAG